MANGVRISRIFGLHKDELFTPELLWQRTNSLKYFGWMVGFPTEINREKARCALFTVYHCGKFETFQWFHWLVAAQVGAG